MTETIFAVSSGAPPAAIAVVRISGAAAFPAAEAMAGSLPEPRRVGVRALRDPESGELLDRALVLRFPGPRTATGEDLVELHVHGGRAVVHAVEAALAAIPGLRRAEPGEFTRRALANGRIDLSAAEGLGDLLMAETETQRRLAIRSAEGAVRRAVDGWAARLLGIAAAVEALLDHSDEDDVGGEAELLPGIRADVTALAAEIAAITSRPPVERLRDGVRVVLAGPTNAGKSTLLNALAERDAAIVSPIAGTTRDRVEAAVVRGGTAFLFIDTAGLAEATEDPIEAIGIDRARQALAEADIVLWLGEEPPDQKLPALWLLPRSDAQGTRTSAGRLPISAVTGRGMGKLWDALQSYAAALLPPPDMMALNNRQRDLAVRAVRALEAAATNHDLLLVGEELRAARSAFDAITGRAGVEPMLDALFSRFCIGK